MMVLNRTRTEAEPIGADEIPEPEVGAWAEDLAAAS